MTANLKTAFLSTTFLALGAIASAASAAPLSQSDPDVVETTAPGGEAAIADVLRDEGYSEETIRSLKVTRRDDADPSGRTFLTYGQELLGLKIHGGIVRAVIEENGTLSRVSHRLANLGEARGQVLNQPPSSANVARAVGQPFGRGAPAIKSDTVSRITFEAGDFYHDDPTAERVLIADEDGTLQAGYLVKAWSKEDNELVHSLVDGRGQVVAKEDRTANDSYIAYAISPGRGNATVMQGTKANRTASPRGWLQTSKSQYQNSIYGYNVHAYVDADSNNRPDGGGARDYDANFNGLPNFSQGATASANKRAAVQNLFYQVNAIHDALYGYGFNERAGNFQLDNYGRGGVGGDYVAAEVTDGSGRNNANFATPINDGSAGGQPARMQMYEWTYTSPSRNSSFDGDIVWHEYAHGVSWRLVGQMDGPVSGAVGEGMSDAIAIIMTDDDRMGEWAIGNAKGIRSNRYRYVDKTLADFTGSSVHRDGEIWAAAMWRTWELFKQNGRSKDTLMRAIISGMKATAPGPSFISMRDGLLAGAKGSDDCLIWRAFAEHGMGQGAKMTRSGGKGSIATSTRVPSGCSGALKPASTPTTPTVGAVTSSSAAGIKGHPGQWRAEVKMSVGSALAGKIANVRFESDGKVHWCRIASSGECLVVRNGFTSGARDQVVTITKVDGKAATSKGGSLRLTARNPYSSNAAPSPTGGTVTSSSAAGIKGHPGQWRAEVKMSVGSALAGKIANVRFESDGRVYWCRVKSSGECLVVRHGFTSGASDQRVTITTIDGKPAVSGGGSLGLTARNPY